MTLDSVSELEDTLKKTQSELFVLGFKYRGLLDSYEDYKEERKMLYRELNKLKDEYKYMQRDRDKYLDTTTSLYMEKIELIDKLDKAIKTQDKYKEQLLKARECYEEALDRERINNATLVKIVSAAYIFLLGCLIFFRSA